MDTNLAAASYYFGLYVLSLLGGIIAYCLWSLNRDRQAAEWLEELKNIEAGKERDKQ